MKVIVIGATGRIGREVVKQLQSRHEVVRACRSGADVAVDIESADSIRAMFDAVGPADAVVCAAGDCRFAPMSSLSEEDHGVGLASKLMGQVNLAGIASERLRDHGSITLTAGITARQPIPGTASVAMVNSAVEGFVRAAALELPRDLRINAVSPNWTVETLTLFGMDPSWGVPAAQVALGYLESVEGALTGTVIDAGWRNDPTRGSATLAAPEVRASAA